MIPDDRVPSMPVASLVAGRPAAAHGRYFAAIDPTASTPIEPQFAEADAADVDTACDAAATAFSSFGASDGATRSALLSSIAERLDGAVDDIVARADMESGLGSERLTGELARTTGQLRRFADIAATGSWLDVHIDTALPERQPAPRPDLRRCNVAIGPVAVFAASNFPLAFSVAGGDTASALAVGCPVVVKAHESHPGTSALVGQIVADAVDRLDLPAGVFSLLQSSDRAIATRLVAHPAISAVAFTGSQQGGRALMRAGAERAVPIPVFAEMGSVNPVFVLPGALAARGPDIAAGLANSMTLGTGQFCTQPGVVVGIAGEAWDAFASLLGADVAARPAGVMLNPRVAAGYRAAAERRAADPRLSSIAERTAESRGEADADFGCRGAPIVYRTTAASWAATPELADEMFGPSTLLVDAADARQLVDIAGALPGQLTATIHAEAADRALAAELLTELQRRVGRVVFNGYPTGVEVVGAMQHGGPFPASSDARFTSVGDAAWRRFVRPVCFQAVPDELRPAALRDANPLRLTRTVDGHPIRPTSPTDQTSPE